MPASLLYWYVRGVGGPWWDAATGVPELWQWGSVGKLRAGAAGA